MQFSQRFSELPEYAFPRLRTLLRDVEPGGPEFLMTIGEPKHDFPQFVTPVITRHAADFSRYPPNEGQPELRSAISGWVLRRFGVTVAPETQILPLNGTREGLFNTALALSPQRKSNARPVILMPNPFYPCYAAAALASDAEPVAVPATADSDFLPDFSNLPAETLERTTICYVCSPSNPQGATADQNYWKNLFQLAEKHDFCVFADECYSEIYRNDPPTGALTVAHEAGLNPERLVIFHSLSKRSNAAGLRSGFAAGGVKTIAAMKQLRSYAGAPLPIPLQYAAVALWNDETHVDESRSLYCKKFDLADEIFADYPGYRPPQAGFFLWLKVDDGEQAAVDIYQQTGVQVLPGAYLSRPGSDGKSPGDEYIRVALVSPENQVRDGLTKIRSVLNQNILTERVG